MSKKKPIRRYVGRKASPLLAKQLLPTVPKVRGQRQKEEFPLTMQQEMALAVILWRAVRFSYISERKLVQQEISPNDRSSVRPRCEDKVNDTAIEMAARMGVKDEFFAWLFEFPVFKLYLMGLDPWPEQIAGIYPKDRKLVTVEPPPIEGRG